MGLLALSFVVLKACGLAVLLLLLRGAAWIANMLVIGPLTEPLKRIPGESGSFFQSYLDDVLDPQESPETHDRWRKRYGNTFKFQGFGRHDYRLMTFDFRAITQIMTSPVYEKPWQTRSILGRLIGRGILSMEGHEHRAQRRILGPAFSAHTIKELTPILHQKAEELCDFWDNTLSQLDEDQKPSVVDVTPALGRAAFDAIGLAGFDYAFDSLADDTGADYQAYRKMFGVIEQGVDPRDIVDLYLPFLRNLWPSEKSITLNKSSADVHKLGRKIIERKRAKILADESDEKDVLGLLVKANLASDATSRLSDKDLLDQCTTFLFAGSDSVAVGLTWTLKLLAENPAFQSRLYDELRASQHTKGVTSDGYESAGSDDSGFVEDPSLRHGAAHSSQSTDTWVKSLDALPFLDSIVRESLRVSPPVHSTIRVATVDDEIMLSEPILLDSQHPSHSVKIRKGTYIHLPIEGLNMSEDIWGPDARVFNPDRWTKLPEKATSLPSLGGVVSFGYGPHSCLGRRFVIAEMKVFLAALVLRFEFAPVEGVNIMKWNSFVTRPYIEEVGRSPSQLPLHVSRRV